jgi:triacylglycerol lipase
MFWIHGGGNMNGQSIFYNGTALVQHSITIQHPIIYVSINYRLGGFGFLNSPAFQAAGISNLGLKDQYLALQWVHENIASFGGDPDSITIFGESAGAANCWSQLHYAYTHNETNKYFRAMITESGAPGSPAFPLALKPRTGAPSYKKLLAKTGCIGKGIPCLRKVPHHVISPLLVNQAIIDYTLDHDWFDADLASLVESGQFAALPIIHGTNFDEGSFFMPDPMNPPNRAVLIKTVAGYLDKNTQDATNIVDSYISLPDAALGKGVKGDPSAPRDYWVALAAYTDIFMDLGKQTLLPIASQKADVWGYDFRQQPPLNSLNLSYEYPGASKTFAERVGVYHGSELPYVFGEVTHLPHHTQGDVQVAIAVMDAWISFAYCMDPNLVKSKFCWKKCVFFQKLTLYQTPVLLCGHDSTRAALGSSWRLSIKVV